MSLFLAAVRFQLQTMRRSPDYLMALVTIPLLCIAFLSILRHAGREDLVPFAVLGSAMMTVWATALFVSGELVEADRFLGTLEGLLAAPANLQVVILSRLTVVTTLSFLGLAESSLIAWLVFGFVVTVPHAGLFVLTLLCTALAMTGTASIMAALFVLARSARIFQNSLSYPIYLLGGTVVPVSILPGWLQPMSKLVFLSWSSDLLRDCLRAPEPERPLLRLGIIVGLGAIGLVIGLVLTRVIVRRITANGSVGYA